MPMNENLPTWRIADNLEHMRIWELVEQRVTLVVECVSCRRHTTWPPELMRKRLKPRMANRLSNVAGRFRCAACRSAFVWISRESKRSGSQTGAQTATQSDRPDPGQKRGFTDVNLDANARGGGGLG